MLLKDKEAGKSTELKSDYWGCLPNLSDLRIHAEINC